MWQLLETRDIPLWKAQSQNSHRPLSASADHRSDGGKQRKARTNMSDIFLSWLHFARKDTRCCCCCRLVWPLFPWQPLNMKTTSSKTSPKRSSCLSPPRMDSLWTVTRQRTGPNPSGIWIWVCVCAGSLQTAWGSACCAVAAADTMRRPLRGAGSCASAGTSWRARPVRGSAGRTSPRCSCLPPAGSSWRSSAGELPTDICTLRTPGWDLDSSLVRSGKWGVNQLTVHDVYWENGGSAFVFENTCLCHHRHNWRSLSQPRLHIKSPQSTCSSWYCTKGWPIKNTMLIFLSDKHFFFLVVCHIWGSLANTWQRRIREDGCFKV